MQHYDGHLTGTRPAAEEREKEKRAPDDTMLVVDTAGLEFGPDGECGFHLE
jgi:hypothetical protein